MHRNHRVAATLCAVAVVGGIASPAYATSGKVVRSAAVASHGAGIADAKRPVLADAAAATKAPAGYVRVESAVLAAPEDLQTAGSVKCPGAKVPVGGGVTIASDDVNDNINSSYPSGKSWVVDVNNDSFSDTTFTVFAVCATKPAGYQVTESAAVTNPADTQSAGSVVCSGTKVPWGGGFFSTSGNVAVNVNSSYPTGLSSRGWGVYMNNLSTSDAGFFAFAVCANKPRLYAQPLSSGTSNPFSQDNAAATCGAGEVTTGGGAFSASTSLVVNLNSTAPSTSTSWRTWTNNNTSSSYSFNAFAVCVGL